MKSTGGGSSGPRWRGALIWILLAWQVVLTFLVLHGPGSNKRPIAPQQGRLTLEDVAMGVPQLDLSGDLPLTQVQARQLASIMDSMAAQIASPQGGKTESREMLEAYIAKTILTPAQSAWIDHQKRILQASSTKGAWIGHDRMVDVFRQFVAQRAGGSYETAFLDSAASGKSQALQGPSPSPVLPSPAMAPPPVASPTLADASPRPAVSVVPSPPPARPSASPVTPPVAASPVRPAPAGSPALPGQPGQGGDRLVLTLLLGGILALEKDATLALDATQTEKFRTLVPDIKKILDALAKGQISPAHATVERTLRDLLRPEQKRYIAANVPESAPGNTLLNELQDLLKKRDARKASPSP